MSAFLEIPVIPAKNSETPVSGVLISSEEGNVEASETLPGNVQNNIEAEKIKFSDSTINNVSTNNHGFIPKSPGDNAYVFTGTGWDKLSRIGSGFGNIYYVPTGELVTIGQYYENVVTTMQIYGTLQIYGKLTIL